MRRRDGQPIFFIDRSLGSDDLRIALVANGARVEIHDDHFAKTEKDTVWLAEVGRRGWVIISKDGKIRQRTLERRALKAASVHAFFIGNGSRGGAMMAEACVKAYPKMLAVIERASSPIWMSIHVSGRLTVLPQEPQASIRRARSASETTSSSRTRGSHGEEPNH